MTAELFKAMKIQLTNRFNRDNIGFQSFQYWSGISHQMLFTVGNPSYHETRCLFHPEDAHYTDNGVWKWYVTCSSSNTSDIQCNLNGFARWNVINSPRAKSLVGGNAAWRGFVVVVASSSVTR